MYRKKNKYKNKKVTVDGIVYDSQKEAVRWQELKLLERGGLIQNLRRQVKFELAETKRQPDIIGKRGGITKGKVILRSCSYIADFVYEENGVQVVEDTKGFKTKEYEVKKKWLYDKYGILIKEV